jgi:hypothetical protein
MAKKPTYEELEQKVKELQREVARCRRDDVSFYPPTQISAQAKFQYVPLLMINTNVFRWERVSFQLHSLLIKSSKSLLTRY